MEPMTEEEDIFLTLSPESVDTALGIIAWTVTLILIEENKELWNELCFGLQLIMGAAQEHLQTYHSDELMDGPDVDMEDTNETIH
jgi:hypothetical protein